MARLSAMQSILVSLLPREQYRNVEDSEAYRLAQAWFSGDTDVIAQVDQLLAEAGLSEADITAQSLSTKATEFDRLDRQNERHEYRRDAILQQIERRRAGWAQQVKRASEDVADAEFEESSPRTLPDRTTDELRERRR
jgi:hypothetical protein